MVYGIGNLASTEHHQPHKHGSTFRFLMMFSVIIPILSIDLRKRTMIITTATWMEGLPIKPMTPERRLTGLSGSY